MSHRLRDLQIIDTRIYPQYSDAAQQVAFLLVHFYRGLLPERVPYEQAWRNSQIKRRLMPTSSETIIPYLTQ